MNDLRKMVKNGYSNKSGVDAAWERYLLKVQADKARCDRNLLKRYQENPNDIMFTQNPAKLARVKELMARC